MDFMRFIQDRNLKPTRIWERTGRRRALFFVPLPRMHLEFQLQGTLINGRKRR